MERALIAILAMALNALFMGKWAREALLPVFSYPQRTIHAIEQRLNRPQRTAKVRRQRGMLLLTAALTGAAALGLAVSRMRWPLLEAILLALMLPLRPGWDLARAIQLALQQGDIAAARLVLKGSPWRHFALLDDHGLARAAIEILAVGFSEKLLTPVFWYVVLGMPGLLMARVLYLLQETLCQPLHPGNDFGQPVALTHGIVAFLPSRLAALLWIPASAFLPSAFSARALKQVLKGMASAALPQQVSVLAAASALGVSLGGPISVYTAGQWEGGGTAKAGVADIRHGLYLWVLVQLFVLMLLMFMV